MDILQADLWPCKFRIARHPGLAAIGFHKRVLITDSPFINSYLGWAAKWLGGTAVVGLKVGLTEGCSHEPLQSHVGSMNKRALDIVSTSDYQQSWSR